MRKYIFMMILLLTGISMYACGSKRVTVADYDTEQIPVPYGSPVEDRDYSEQTDALKEAGRKITEHVNRYVDTAENVLDAADRVSDTVSAGATKVGSIADRVTDFLTR